jgi:hypothetical protein
MSSPVILVHRERKGSSHMKRRLTLVAFMGLLSLLGATACSPAEKYGLFGEFSEEGATVRAEGASTVDGMKNHIETPTGPVTTTVSVNERYAGETTILEAADGKPTKMRRVVETDVTDSVTELMGQSEKDTEKDPLHGETIVMMLADGEWTAELEEGTPTEAQRESLADLSQGLFVSIYPDRELEVGEQWTVPQEALLLMADADAENVQGTMTCTLTAIEEYKGEQCALVDYDLEVSFDDTSTKGQELNSKFTLSGKVYRSLDSHLDLLNEGSGTVTWSGTMTEGGQSMAFSGTGPMTLKETLEIVK